MIDVRICEISNGYLLRYGYDIREYCKTLEEIYLRLRQMDSFRNNKFRFKKLELEIQEFKNDKHVWEDYKIKEK